MNDAECSLTVYFDDPFWVGVYERAEGGMIAACRVIFGAEPKDFEVYEYFMKNWDKLRFSPPVAREKRTEKKANPKRIRRLISTQLTQKGTGTKAQQALKLQQEQNIIERRSYRRLKKEEEKERDFEIRQQKKKEKRRGR